MSSSITKNELSLETTGCLKRPGGGTFSKPFKRKSSNDASPKRSKKKAKICARVELLKDSVDSMDCDTSTETVFTSVEKRTDLVKAGRLASQYTGSYSASDENKVCFDSEQKLTNPESLAVDREPVELLTFSSSSTLVSSSSTLVEHRNSLVTN